MTLPGHGCGYCTCASCEPLAELGLLCSHPRRLCHTQVSLSEQASQRRVQAQSANARINAKTSDGRIYSIDEGLETSVFIDPNRNVQVRITVSLQHLPRHTRVRVRA